MNSVPIDVELIIVDMPEKFVRLVHIDTARLTLLSFGDVNAENAILHLGADVVLIDAGWEVEAAGELADAAFGEPVLGVVLGLVVLLLLFDLTRGRDLGLGSSLGSTFGFIFDCGVMALTLGFFSFGDGTAYMSVLNMAGRRCPGRVVALDFAANEHGLRLGELNVNVFLDHSGQLAVEFVGVSDLADIKLGLPVQETCPTAIGLCILARVGVKVVEKTEEGSEGGVIVVKVAREESHRADLGAGRLKRCLLHNARESSRNSRAAGLHEVFVGMSFCSVESVV